MSDALPLPSGMGKGDALPMPVVLPMEEGRSSRSEGYDSELVDAAHTSLLQAAAQSGVLPSGQRVAPRHASSGSALGACAPQLASVLGPSPDHYAADTPEPYGDSRTLGPTPPAESPKCVPLAASAAGLPVLLPVSSASGACKLEVGASVGSDAPVCVAPPPTVNVPHATTPLPHMGTAAPTTSLTSADATSSDATMSDAPPPALCV